MNTLDMFEYFVEYVKSNTLENIIKEWGGGNIYIPSFKSTYRDKHILNLYKQGTHIEDIAKEFNLSISRVRGIIKKQQSKE